MIAKWIGKRVIMGTIVLIIVSFLSFFLMHAAPGNPAAAYYGGNAQTLSTAEKERIETAFGLDQPILYQYGVWLREAMQGNLGYSAKEGRPVATIIQERLPNTLQLVVGTLGIVAIASAWLGLQAGMKEGSLLDRGLSFVSIASSAIPPFWHFIHHGVLCTTRLVSFIGDEGCTRGWRPCGPTTPYGSSFIGPCTGTCRGIRTFFTGKCEGREASLLCRGGTCQRSTRASYS